MQKLRGRSRNRNYKVERTLALSVKSSRFHAFTNETRRALCATETNVTWYEQDKNVIRPVRYGTLLYAEKGCTEQNAHILTPVHFISLRFTASLHATDDCRMTAGMSLMTLDMDRKYHPKGDSSQVGNSKARKLESSKARKLEERVSGPIS